MKSVRKELVEKSLLQATQEERLAPFANAMRMSRGAWQGEMSTAKPFAQRSTNGWSAALWIADSDNPTCGELVQVTDKCRTKKLALITANYYRLHQLLHQTGPSTNTPPLH